MLEIGSLLENRYRIMSIIGQGGMSTVYYAINERINKPLAIKVIRKDGSLNYETVKRSLIAETKILKSISHPYLPSIFDVIDSDDSLILVMEYVEGTTLDKVLQEQGVQSQELVVKWAMQLCDMLHYLHNCNPAIIYRDMKPSNIMLKPDGNIKLIDFGTAREYSDVKYEDTICLGTMGYAAPEQSGGMGQTDARTDIFSLGATLYHLLTGYSPAEPPYVIRPIRDINPLLSADLERIILKCTNRNPLERYQSISELMSDLIQINYSNECETTKKKRTLYLAISIVALVLVAISVIGLNRIKKNSDTSNDSSENVVTKISSSKELQEDNRKIESTKTEPEKEKQITYLQDLQYISYDNQGCEDNSFAVIKGNVTSFDGNTYDNGLLFSQRVFQSRTLSYKLDCNYKFLSGTISMIQKISVIGMDQSDYMTNELVHVELYGENGLVYKSPLTNLSTDIKFEIDVSEIKELVIKIIPQREGNLRSGTSYVALTNLELHSNANNMTSTDPDGNIVLKNVKQLQELQYINYNNQECEDNNFAVIKGSVTSFDGTKYDNGLLFSQRVFQSRVLSYYLGSKYKKLSGTISMIEKISIIGMDQSDYMTNELFTIEIVGDDKSLYMSPLTNLSTSISFEIDVTNINRIDIKVIPQREGNLRSGTSYVAISGLELS